MKRVLIAPPISQGGWTGERNIVFDSLTGIVCALYTKNGTRLTNHEANTIYIAACKGAYEYLEKEWNRMNKTHTELVDAGIVGTWHPHKALEELETILLKAGYTIKTDKIESNG